MWPYKHQLFIWLNARWQGRPLTWIWLLMNTYCDVEKKKSTLLCIFNQFVSHAGCSFCSPEWTFVFFLAISHVCDSGLKMDQKITEKMRDQFIQVYPLYLKTTYEYYLTLIEWCFYNVSDYNFSFTIGSQCYTYLWTFYEKMSIKTHDCDWDLTDLCNASYHKLIDILGHCHLNQ